MLLATANTHALEILRSLFVMLIAAKLLAEVAERLRQPAVIGEILAGVLIGPSLLGWVAPSGATDLLSELGVIFLLFTVGLHTKPSDLTRVGRTALQVALLGILLPLAAGWALLRGFGQTNVVSLFVGTAMVATSVGITARVLTGLGVLEAPASRIILGAAVIDDILGLLVLAIVSSVATGTVDYWQLGKTSALAVGFTLMVTFAGAPLFRRAVPWIERLRISHALLIIALLLGLGFAALAGSFGIAPIVGAFLAGMAMAEAAERADCLPTQIGGITEFLVPFFFVSIGLQVRLDVFRDPMTIWLTVLVTVVALATKLLGCGAGAGALGWRGAAQVGVGMMPRGEVGIVVAQLGLGLGLVSDSLFGVILFMSVATTLVTPPFLKMLFARETTNRPLQAD